MIMNPVVSLSAQPATIPQNSSRRSTASGAQPLASAATSTADAYRQPLPPKKFPQIQPTRLIPERRLNSSLASTSKLQATAARTHQKQKRAKKAKVSLHSFWALDIPSPHHPQQWRRMFSA